MKNTDFSFIINNVELPFDTVVKIKNDFTFRKANNEEISVIKEMIDSVIRKDLDLDFRPHEYTFIKNESLINRVHNPKEQWRYWVIEHHNYDPTSNKFKNLNRALKLLDPDLTIGFSSFTYNNERCETHLFKPHIIERLTSEQFHYVEPVQMNIDELYNIENLINNFPNETEHPEFNHYMSMFADLEKLPPDSPLIDMGYISIIESIITHKPRLSETLDSLSHQINNKMVLLSKRFNKKIKSEWLNPNVDMNKLWKAIYSYRSRIAHGLPIDFSDKEFSALKSKSDTSNLLKHALKELIILFCQDPVFINDLKAC